jgi:hypothetical protein
MLASNIRKAGLGLGLSGPTWQSMSLEFATVFSTWVSSPVNIYKNAVGAPVTPVVLSGVVNFDTSRVSLGSMGPSGMSAERAILIGLGLTSCPVRPAGMGSGVPVPGPGLVVGLGGLFTGNPSPLSLALCSGGVTTFGGPSGRSWLLDFGMRLQAGLGLSGTVTVTSPVPSGPSSVGLMGVLCLA